MLARVLTRIRHALSPPAWSANRDPLGPAGEKAAERHLRARGYAVLARNAKVPMGEADLLCTDPDGRTIVLVEVKSRRLDPALPTPPPELSITAHKRRKLVAILRHLARANRWRDRPLRIDVVAVDFHGDTPRELRHHVGAVTLR